MTHDASVQRPALRYHGGKWRLAPWIISHFPEHSVYTEPFGGGASVLLRKPRAYAEVYNDLDGEVVDYFRVLRDSEASARLQHALLTTPFARDEFNAAYEPTDCLVERARRLLIRSFMGFGSDGFNVAVKTGFRAASNRSGTTPAHDWARYPANIAALARRMSGVVIENRPALDIMRQHDSERTLHYVDPPYVHETRSAKSRRGGVRYHAYRHEMDDSQHEELLRALRRLKGCVLLSGYATPLYDDMLADWRRVERHALADGARARIEVLWLNPTAPAPDIFA